MSLRRGARAYLPAACSADLFCVTNVEASKASTKGTLLMSNGGAVVGTSPTGIQTAITLDGEQISGSGRGDTSPAGCHLDISKPQLEN